MSDIKLFRIREGQAEELAGQSVSLEKSLQRLIELHLPVLLGVRFLASEYSTGRKHAGRIDTLGIDENGAPVIIEYKRSLNENVINQGLFYLDWLLDHRAEFKLLVMDVLGNDAAQDISWEDTRLVCIAGDFTRYDRYAVEQINRNLELMRYRRYGEELLLLELVNSVQATTETTTTSAGAGATDGTQSNYQKPTPLEALEKADMQLQDLYAELKAFATGLGDDVQIKPLKMYIAFRRLKNFMCVEPHPVKGTLTLFLKVDPDALQLKPGFTRDVRQIGHYGTGDLEVSIGSREQLLEAHDLISRSYEAS